MKTMNELRSEAKSLDINSHGMSKEELSSAVEAAQHPTDEERAAKPRRKDKRTPLGTNQPKLKGNTPRGFVGRFVNDTPGRLEQAQAGGYEYVMNEDGHKHSEIVGTNPDGSAMRAFEMKIPSEFYDDDQTAKQAEINKVDKAIKRGNIRKANPQDTDKFYGPEQGQLVESGLSVRSD